MGLLVPVFLFSVLLPARLWWPQVPEDAERMPRVFANLYTDVCGSSERVRSHPANPFLSILHPCQTVVRSGVSLKAGEGSRGRKVAKTNSVRVLEIHPSVGVFEACDAP